MRELRLDVFAHLDGALVQERLAVIEEVDAPERRPRFVDHLREQIEVEHAGLARARDAGLRRAHRLVARNVAGGGALDIEAAGNRADVEIALRAALSSASGSFNGQSPQKLEPPWLMSARSCEAIGPVQMPAIDVVRASPSTRLAYGSAQPQTMRPSHSSTPICHGHEQV